jgi:hypothetical protein
MNDQNKEPLKVNVGDLKVSVRTMFKVLERFMQMLFEEIQNDKNGADKD